MATGDAVYKILQDSRGFLWLATFDGVARFDGYSFVNFSTPQGLPSRRINDLIEARDGTFWLATQAGLVHFDPHGNPQKKVITADEAAALSEPPMFTTHAVGEDERTNTVLKVFQDSFDAIWVGTLRGLFRLDAAKDSARLETIEIGLPEKSDDRRNVNIIYEDRFRTLWIGTASGLYRRWSSGDVQRFGEPPNFSAQNNYRAFFEDAKGRFWVGTSYEGLLELQIDGSQNQPLLKQHFKDTDGFTSNWINHLLEISPQEIWLATDAGLVSFKPDETAQNRFHIFTRTSGIGFQYLNCLYKDANGGLWFGGKGGGLGKIKTSRWKSFDDKDGVAFLRALSTQNNGDLSLVGF